MASDAEERAEMYAFDKELSRLEEERGETDIKLRALERQIYALEGTYLRATAGDGNIARGWAGYLRADATSSHASKSGESSEPRFFEDDRLFSKSSVTYEDALEARSDDDAAKRERDERSERPPSPRVTRHGGGSNA